MSGQEARSFAYDQIIIPKTVMKIELDKYESSSTE